MAPFWDAVRARTLRSNKTRHHDIVLHVLHRFYIWYVDQQRCYRTCSISRAKNEVKFLEFSSSYDNWGTCYIQRVKCYHKWNKVPIDIDNTQRKYHGYVRWLKIHRICKQRIMAGIKARTQSWLQPLKSLSTACPYFIMSVYQSCSYCVCKGI